MSHIWMSHVTHVNESCQSYEWVMSHMWMSHVNHMNESCYTCEWVMSIIWMSHVTHVNESCHTYECVMSHIWMSDQWQHRHKYVTIIVTNSVIFVTNMTMSVSMTMSNMTMSITQTMSVWRCLWHASFICVTWLIHTCNMTHSHTDIVTQTSYLTSSYYIYTQTSSHRHRHTDIVCVTMFDIVCVKFYYTCQTSSHRRCQTSMSVTQTMSVWRCLCTCRCQIWRCLSHRRFLCDDVCVYTYDACYFWRCFVLFVTMISDSIVTNLWRSSSQIDDVKYDDFCHIDDPHSYVWHDSFICVTAHIWRCLCLWRCQIWRVWHYRRCQTSSHRRTQTSSHRRHIWHRHIIYVHRHRHTDIVCVTDIDVWHRLCDDVWHLW